MIVTIELRRSGRMMSDVWSDQDCLSQVAKDIEGSVNDPIVALGLKYISDSEPGFYAWFWGDWA